MVSYLLLTKDKTGYSVTFSAPARREGYNEEQFDWQKYGREQHSVAPLWRTAILFKTLYYFLLYIILFIIEYKEEVSSIQWLLFWTTEKWLLRRLQWLLRGRDWNEISGLSDFIFPPTYPVAYIPSSENSTFKFVQESCSIHSMNHTFPKLKWHCRLHTFSKGMSTIIHFQKDCCQHIWLKFLKMDIFPNSCHFFFNFKLCLMSIFALRHLLQLVFLVKHVRGSQEN